MHYILIQNVYKIMSSLQSNKLHTDISSQKSLLLITEIDFPDKQCSWHSLINNIATLRYIGY